MHYFRFLSKAGREARDFHHIQTSTNDLTYKKMPKFPKRSHGNDAVADETLNDKLEQPKLLKYMKIESAEPSSSSSSTLPLSSSSEVTDYQRKLSPAEKKEKFKNDKKEDFEYFWREQSPFSQFHPAQFTLDGVTYCCAEQYMMHQKALVFKDEEIAKKIMKTSKPIEQKKLGRKVRNFDPEIWSKTCVNVVKKGNIAKFSQNEHLKKKLLATHPKIMAEASPRDCIWGIGLSEKNEKSWTRATWRGRNLLGYALTDVRNELMNS